MTESDINQLNFPENSGPEMDLLLARLMGWKHWSGSELTAKMHLEGISDYPTVSIPKFSTDHNAFFEHVTAYFTNLDMNFAASYLKEDQMWKVEITTDKGSFSGKEYELPHAGSLAAIYALQKARYE